MRLVDNIFNSMLGKSEPYIDCDYLESDSGGQYIDTGVLASSSLRIVCKCFGRSGYTNLITFGSRDGFNSREISLRLYSPALAGKMTVAYGSSAQTVIATFVASEIYDIDFNRNVVTVVGSQGTSGTVTMTAATFASATNSIYLFGFNGTSTPSVPGVCICECQIYDNDVLVRDYRSKIRREDGVTGFLDMVNDTFNPSANGVNFLYGYLT